MYYDNGGKNPQPKRTMLFKKKKLIHNPFEQFEILNKKMVVYDIESYPNYFLCKFLTNSGQYLSFTGDQLNALRVKLNDPELVLIGFNNVWYDDLMLKYLIYNRTVTTEDLYNMTEFLINGQDGNTKSREFWNIYNLSPTWYRSIDIMKLPKQDGGLKVRACALHAKTIKDLPLPPGTIFTEDQKVVIDKYCGNDLTSTLLVYNSVLSDIANRLELERMYPGTNLISKHDAGVCEEIMLVEYCRRNNLKKWELKKTIPRPGQQICLADTIPHYIEFKSETLQALYTFVQKKSGVFSTKEQKKTLTYPFEFDGIKYNFGAGGVHSDDESLFFKPDNEHLLIEIDVDSFYLAMIHNLQITPKQLNNVYNDIIHEQTVWRLEAKYTGNKEKANALKPPLLSAFGKTGSEYSIMFCELAQLKITIGCQLSFLMLIEILAENNLHVISGNTDGVVLKIKKTDLPHLRKVYQHWESVTGCKLSEEYYSTYIRRDINNYIAINTEGETIKEKGVFKKTIKGKASIISRAVKTFFTDKIPIEQTINECTDITQFIYYFHCDKEFWLKHRRTNNQMIELQPTSRWYVTNENKYNFTLGTMVKFGTMTEAEQNRWKATHKLDFHPNDWEKQENIANGANSIVIETLPDEFPKNINYNWYIIQANELLDSVIPKPKIKFNKK